MDAEADRPGSLEEVTLALSDPSYPFVGLSAREGCRVELERMLPRGAERYAEFFTVAGADPDRVEEVALEHEQVEPTVLARHEDGGLFEFVVSDVCPAGYLAELGALPREVRSTDGDGRLVAEVPPGYDAAEVASAFLDEHASAELVGKREKDHSTPLFTDREFERAVEECLTERQREVLRTAYEAGYYDRPRRTTAQELAADFGISSATFSQHVRAAERNLLAIVYDGDTI